MQLEIQIFKFRLLITSITPLGWFVAAWMVSININIAFSTEDVFGNVDQKTDLKVQKHAFPSENHPKEQLYWYNLQQSIFWAELFPYQIYFHRLLSLRPIFVSRHGEASAPRAPDEVDTTCVTWVLRPLGSRSVVFFWGNSTQMTVIFQMKRDDSAQYWS